MPAPSTADDLLELVSRSGLVPPADLGRLRPLRAGGPREAADALVRDGLLTEFQAKNLLAGRYKRMVLGPYKLLGLLGSGGMGTVYAAAHTALGRQVALKVLPPDRAAHASDLQRFHREARAAAALDHPNVVRCHDVCHEQGVHFIVMEYVDGKTLDQVVRHFGPLPVPQAVSFLAQTAAGLQHAHERGLVHRDVKPGNLLLDRSGVVKILDMGLARFFDDREHSLTKRLGEGDHVLGTADYIAPEQGLDSAAADIRSDVYSLGATAYTLLTGRPPFADASTAQKLLMHQMREVPALHAARRGVPAELSAVVSKMLAKRPGDRHQTPAEVGRALLPFLAESVERLSLEFSPGTSAVAPSGPPAYSGLSSAPTLPASTLTLPVVAGGSGSAARPPRARRVVFPALAAVVGVSVAVWVTTRGGGIPAVSGPASGSHEPAPPPVGRLPTAPELQQARPHSLPPAVIRVESGGRLKRIDGVGLMPEDWAAQNWNGSAVGEVTVGDREGVPSLGSRTVRGQPSIMLFRNFTVLNPDSEFFLKGRYVSASGGVVRFRDNRSGARDIGRLSPTQGKWAPFSFTAPAPKGTFGAFEFHNYGGELCLSEVSLTGATDPPSPPMREVQILRFEVGDDRPTVAIRTRGHNVVARNGEGDFDEDWSGSAYESNTLAEFGVIRAGGHLSFTLRNLEGPPAGQLALRWLGKSPRLREGHLYRFRVWYMTLECNPATICLRDGGDKDWEREVQVSLPGTAGGWKSLEGRWRCAEDGRLVALFMLPASGPEDAFHVRAMDVWESFSE